jgi:hypothetical protein
MGFNRFFLPFVSIFWMKRVEDFEGAAVFWMPVLRQQSGAM